MHKSGVITIHTTRRHSTALTNMYIVINKYVDNYITFCIEYDHTVENPKHFNSSLLHVVRFIPTIHMNNEFLSTQQMHGNIDVKR